MNIKSKTSFNPNYAVHPGEILSDILESKGISQIELCKRMGRPEKTISEIISGKSAITAETALQLEQALGIPAEFWNRLESTYQEINTKLKNKEKLKDEVKCLRNYPYKELINRGWINKRDSDVDQAEELLRYFGVTSLQNLQSVMPVAFRVTKAKTVQAENIAAWLWKQVKATLPELTWVTVFETGSCGANFDGKSYRIWKEFSMDSAVRHSHAPPGSASARIHGHTFTLRLHLSSPLDEVMGWTVDFGDVKEIFNPIFKALDHQPLYELPGIMDNDSATLASWIFESARSDLPSLYRVDLFETPGSGCIVADRFDTPTMPVWS